MAIEGFLEEMKAIQQFEKATALRGEHKVEGEAARSKAIALRTVSQTLSRIIFPSFRMTARYGCRQPTLRVL